MNALIIDDHKINYVIIKNLLKENFPEVNSIDTADSVISARALLAENNYDLMFLDMQLQDGVGFDVLKEMTDFVYIIVVSSHKEYALDAFKYNVVDYLLKPLNTEEFKAAVNKFMNLYKTEILKKSSEDPEITDSENSERIFVSNKNEYTALDKKDILFVKAQGKYSVINTVNGSQYVSSKHLKEFEISMAPMLIRIHHSYLVNINYIISYSRETLQLTLVSGPPIPVSVRKREELFKNLRVY